MVTTSSLVPEKLFLINQGWSVKKFFNKIQFASLFFFKEKIDKISKVVPFLFLQTLFNKSKIVDPLATEKMSLVLEKNSLQRNQVVGIFDPTLMTPLCLKKNSLKKILSVGYRHRLIIDIDCWHLWHLKKKLKKIDLVAPLILEKKSLKNSWQLVWHHNLGGFFGPCKYYLKKNLEWWLLWSLKIIL